MGRESRLLPILLAIAVIATYGLVLSSPTASAASRTWTTDTDFNSPGAQFTSTEVVGTGVPASVQLLKDTIDWRNMTPSTAPAAREGPGLAFAANGNLTFLFGGYDGTYLDDTWQYDFSTNQWTRINVNPHPPGRESPGFSYDPVQHVVVLFGGLNGTNPNLYETETWQFDVVAKTWSKVTPTVSPGLMIDAPMVYDPVAARHILVGANSTTNAIETWAYDAVTTTWSLRTSGSPTVRTSYGLAYDVQRQRTVLFGGFEPVPFPGMTKSDTWEYDYVGNVWRLTVPDGGGPPARVYPSMTYRPASRSVILFGGGIPPLADSWSYSETAVWQRLSTLTAPPSRRLAGFTYDTKSDVGVLYGGLGSSGTQLADTWTMGAAFRAAGRYSSSVFDSGGANVDWQALWWNRSTQPPLTFLRFQLATADVSNPPLWNFVGPGGSSSAYYIVPGTPPWTGHDTHRFLRFLADFGSTDPQASPVMEDVGIDYNVPPAPPYIVSTDPRDLTFNVPMDKVLQVVFSEPMDAASVTWTFLRGTVVTLTPQWSPDGTILNLTHTVNFAENKVYQIRVDGRDLDGNALVPGPVPNPFTFVTAKYNPYIANTDPAGNQMDVLLTAPITVQFNESMNTTSLQWTISPPDVTLNPSWNAPTNDIVTLSHTTPFVQCTVYTVNITQATDLAGLPLRPGSKPNPWSFTSLCINPYVTSTSPNDLQGQVPVASTVIVNFSKQMSRASTTLTIVPDLSGKSFQWSNGDKTLTLTHTSPLTGCQNYTVTATGADTLGNTLFAGPPTAAPNPFKFMTVCSNPYIIATVPSDGATDVSLSQTILIAFSEQMIQSSVQYIVTPTIVVTSVVWRFNQEMDISHTGLRECTNYVVHVTAGTSQAGFPLVPGIALNPWRFSTICVSPYITSTDPADGASLVPLNQPIVVQFSEPMVPSSVVVTPTPNIALSRTWSNGNQTLTLTHVADFSNCTTYSIFVDGVGADGNSLLIPGPRVPDPWSFSTFCITTSPYIVRTDPASGVQNVPLTKAVVVDFSEPMSRASLQWVFSPTVTGVSPAWTNGDATVTLSHAAFVECRVYTVTIYAKDVDGNNLINVTGSKPNPWSFRAACLAPFIVSTDPANGTPNVPLTQSIVVTFSETMVRSSVSVTPQPSISLTSSWSVGDTVLTLTHAPFAAGTMYVITVRGRDVDGNDLVAGPVPNPWSFTTTNAALPAPPGLLVTRQPPTDILLTWRSVPGASSYVIYSSTDRFAPWPWPSRGEVTLTSFVASGDLPETTARYYIVRAKTSGGLLGLNSTMGAKVPLSFVFVAGRTSIFWFSLPYRSAYARASDISNELTSARIDVIGKWNPLKQTSILWYLFRGQWRGTNFAINPGDGLWIGVKTGFTWVVTGTDGAVPLTFTVYPAPSNNLNWISLPYTSRYRQASDLVLEIEGSLGAGANTKIVEVAKWDGTTQSLVRFYWTTSGWTGTDFAISAGEGVYMKVVATFVWTPRLITPEVP